LTQPPDIDPGRSDVASDSVSEQLAQQALNRAARGRTTLVIAHRLSTIREADWIVVIEDGRLVEQGTWDDLKAQAGVFDRLLSGMAKA
jgi:ATP-binding cassette subfamily B protein